MTKKTILLVTTNGVNNYGAALQAYALKDKLADFGEVSILNYVNRHIGSSMDLVRINPSLHGLLGSAKDIFRLVPRRHSIQKFRAFEQKYFNLTVPMTRESLGSGRLSSFDIYVSGSDQIWNPNCISACGAIDGTYFLDFAHADSRKAAFSSSMGGYKPNASEMSELTSLLADYDRISVREIDTKEMLSTHLKRHVRHSLDPTLMMDSEDWSTFPDTDVLSRTPDRYLLLYSVPKLPLVMKATIQLARKFDLGIVALDQDPFIKIRTDSHIRDAGPEDFITLFRNAAFVVTDSFHGTCFSINFEIPFCSISHGVHSNRITSLLNLVKLDNRFMSRPEQLQDVSQFVDFSVSQRILAQERMRDSDYISSFAE